MSVVEVSKISGDLVTVAQAFTWCRIDGYNESHPEYALVQSLIKAAEQDIEEYLNRVIRKRTFEYRLRAFYGFEVDKYPCLSIDSVKYFDGAAFVDLPAENLEKVQIDNERFCINFKETLPTVADRYDAVKVTVTCGYELANVPEYIKLAMQLMVGEFYDNRGNGKREFPTVVEGILRKYRMMRV